MFKKLIRSIKGLFASKKVYDIRRDLGTGKDKREVIAVFDIEKD